MIIRSESSPFHHNKTLLYDVSNQTSIIKQPNCFNNCNNELIHFKVLCNNPDKIPAMEKNVFIQTKHKTTFNRKLLQLIFKSFHCSNERKKKCFHLFPVKCSSRFEKKVMKNDCWNMFFPRYFY